MSEAHPGRASASEPPGDGVRGRSPRETMSETPGARRGRRSASAPEIVVIYWRDIPAQVNAQCGRDRHQVLLPAPFQRAIDRAKRKAHIYTAQQDVAQWRRVSRPCSDDLAGEAEREAARLTAEYPTERLGQIAFAGGLEQ